MERLINLKNINKMWFGTIGDQSKEEPYLWENFSYPKLFKVNILSITQSATAFNHKSKETFFTNATCILKIGTEEISFLIIKSEEMNGVFENYILIPEHIFLGKNEEEVKDRFHKEVHRIVTNKWSGINGNSKSNAIKNYLMYALDGESIRNLYPELVI